MPQQRPIVGFPADGTISMALVKKFLRKESSLRSNPIPLAAGLVGVVATFDAATPTDSRLSVDVLSTIQPATVPGTQEGVYARLVDGVGMTGRSDEHEISVSRVIASAASYGSAMIGGFVARI